MDRWYAKIDHRNLMLFLIRFSDIIDIQQLRKIELIHFSLKLGPRNGVPFKIYAYCEASRVQEKTDCL